MNSRILKSALALAALTGIVAAQNTVFKRHAELDRTSVLANQEQEISVVIKLETPNQFASRDQNRTPLNVGLVIDRSGSMADKGKMEYAKAAAKFIVDNLTSEDRLSIVEYDDRIKVLWPSSAVTSKTQIKRAIDRLEPRGSTNLCGGMQEGIEETGKYIREEKLNRVILLSDGLANQGVTDRSSIYRFARNARQSGVTISTIGLGLEYDEDLMQGIAENGSGRYYYVESPSQMESIFRQELSSLSSTLVQNINIQFRGSGCVKSVKVYGYDCATERGITSIPLSAFYAGESRSVLVKLKVTALSEGKKELGTLHYTWKETESGKIRKDTSAISVEVTSSKVKVASSENKPVLAEVTLIEAEDEHEKNVRLFEQGQEELARQNMVALQSKLSQANSSLSDIRISKKMEAVAMEEKDMDRAAQAPEAKSSYVKQRKQALYYAKKGQRSKYILENGNSGSEVQKLQEKLKDNNMYNGPIDGNYTEEVEAAVKEYQKSNGMTDDGVAGPETLRKLELY